MPSDDIPVGLPFQMYLTPLRAASSPLQLPPGTAVDLQFSGMGISLPATYPGAATRTAGLEFAALPNDVTPVRVVFTPSGDVDHVAYGGSVSVPTGTIHLLVGRFAQVAEPHEATTEEPSPLPWSTSDNTSITFGRNITDYATLWVSIAPRTGTLTTAENAWLTTTENATMSSASILNYRDSIVAARRFAQSSQIVGGR
jgi:hypothetical protein